MDKYIKGTWKDVIATDQGEIVEPGTLITKVDLDRIEDGVESAILNVVPTIKTTGTASELIVADRRLDGINAMNKLWEGYGIKVILHLEPTSGATIKVGGLPAVLFNVKAKMEDVVLVIFDAERCKFVMNKLVGVGTALETSITPELATAMGIPDTPNVEEGLRALNEAVKTNATLALSTITVEGLSPGDVVTATCGTTTMTATWAVGKAEVKFSNIFRGAWSIAFGGNTRECVITGVGDYVVKRSYDQLVNYTMLYDQGDECVAVTGGWKDTTTSAMGFALSKMTCKPDRLHGAYVNATNSPAIYAITSKKIQSSGFSKIGINFDFSCNIPYPSNYNDFSLRHSADKIIFKDFGYGEEIHLPKATSFKGIMQADTISDQYIYVEISYGWTQPATAELNVYNIFLTKKDDWQTLCQEARVTAPATLAELIENTTKLGTIFNSLEAVNFMVKQCTGDFMTSVIGNKTAFGLLGNSTYIGTIMQNEHWSKFIVMSPYLSDWKTQGNTISVPTMTSNTAPSGVVTAYAHGSSSASLAFNSFGGTGYNAGSPGSGVSCDPYYLTYTFPNTICAFMLNFAYAASSQLSIDRFFKTFKIMVSNDGVIWEDITKTLSINMDENVALNKDYALVLKNAKHIKIKPLTITNNYDNFMFPAIQFYGKAVS